MLLKNILGVWITKNLSGPSMFLKLCITCKSKMIIGLFYRQFYLHSNTTILNLQSDHISNMLYGILLQKNNISKLERVIAFALKMCRKNWEANYNFTSCNFPSLKKRCLFLKLSFLIWSSFPSTIFHIKIY